MARRSGTHSDRSRLRGFTLVELVIVVAVIAVIAAIAVPRFSVAQVRSKLDAAASRVVNDIGISSNTARADGSARQIVYDPFSDAYVMMGVRSRGGVLNRMVELRGPPYDTNIVSATFDGLPMLVVNGHGLVEGSGVISLGVGSLGKRIVVTSGSSSVRVDSLELNDIADGNVLPSVRVVTGQVTVDIGGRSGRGGGGQ
ncbi:MAG: prepilin-type N-terminal cleavage/methylation domain-containing protein [Planctomycetota bacterium]